MPQYPGDLNDENLCRIFEGAADFVVRKLRCGDFPLTAYAIDGLTSGGDTSHYIISPLSELTAPGMESLYRKALFGGVYNSVAKACTSLDEAANYLVNGFCVVLFPQVGALAFEVKTPEKRNPSPPEVENTVKGAKDAFVETVRSNTSLIRRHLRTPALRIQETIVGTRSLTNVSVLWVAGITNPNYVERMNRRLSTVDIDGLLSPSAVEEYVTGSRSTAFPLLQYTERTDTFCQGLLEGRVGLLVDGLPLGYLAPVDLGYLMESPEDRGRDWLTASAIRILRYTALVLSLLLPGFYIALATFHQEMIPLPLLRAMIESKRSVPFSTSLEVLGLLIAFELLQESGIHLPQAVGQSVSTIGGIVVGTAAVEAGLISPAALIAVSIAGVCGFVLPNRDLAGAVRLWRFGIAAVSASAGLFGMTVGLIGLTIHMAGLKSLGVPYLTPLPEKLPVVRKRLIFEKFRSPRLHPLDGRNQR